MSTLLGKILADFSTSLATEIAVAGTTATLATATDDDSVALPSGRYFFTIDGSNSSKEHISCDLVGTSLTNIKSLSRQGAETTGVVRKHRIGATVSLTDFGHIKFINDLISGTTNLNSAAPLGYDGAPASLTGNQLATVTYVLGVVNGGAVTFDQQTISAQTSGEALTINDIVYFKESDARWYKVDADATSTFDGLQMGVNKTTAAGAAVTIQVAISGPVSGFSGLSAGSKYYASNTGGAISTSAGTYSVFVGWALTTTILLFTPFVKTLPTQKEKDAIVGSTGIPSSTNKFITQDNTLDASDIDIQTTQDSSTVVGAANTTGLRNKVAQSFVPTKTRIRGVKLYKSANTGTFTGTVTVTLEADSAGSPSGSALATETITNAEWLALLVGEIVVTFTSEYQSLVVGSTYWIKVVTSTSDTSNCINLGINTAGGYASGLLKYNNTTDGWVTTATDIYLKLIDGRGGQIVKTTSSGTIDTDLLPSSQYLVGVQENNFVKRWFNAQLLFIMATGDSVGGTTTNTENWNRDNTDVVPSNGGATIEFGGAGTSRITLSNPFTGLQWSATYKFAADWFFKGTTTSAGDNCMGFSDAPDDVYSATTGKAVAFVKNGVDGKLYAKIEKSGVGATLTEITGVTLTNWNHFRIEVDPSSEARFYVNGFLKAIIADGANFPDDPSNVYIGFGKDDTDTFYITAPNVAVELIT
jgi:hypothetical protein